MYEATGESIPDDVPRLRPYAFDGVGHANGFGEIRNPEHAGQAFPDGSKMCVRCEFQGNATGKTAGGAVWQAFQRTCDICEQLLFEPAAVPPLQADFVVVDEDNPFGHGVHSVFPKRRSRRNRPGSVLPAVGRYIAFKMW